MEPPDQPIYIVTEFMCNEILLDYLRHGSGQELELPALVDIAAQIVFGIAYLEHEHYIHRDLEARNGLVGENDVVKIANVDLAHIISEGEIFSIKWTASEAAIFDKFTIKSDVWSYGILLYQLVTYAMTNREVLDQIQRGYRIAWPKNCSDKIYDYI
ncbi:unnamed protein product [Rotaria sp. Silwood2]|nr:unnamed protein product [Rotaria sp. Silwood2]